MDTLTVLYTKPSREQHTVPHPLDSQSLFHRIKRFALPLRIYREIREEHQTGHLVSDFSHLVSLTKGQVPVSEVKQSKNKCAGWSPRGSTSRRHPVGPFNSKIWREGSLGEK